MDTFELNIDTPRREVLHLPVKQAAIPAGGGMLGILPEHAPLLGALGTGILTWEAADGSTGRLVVSGGFLDVADNRATLLADLAEMPEEIDAEAARADLAAAEQEIHTAEPEGGAEAAHRRLLLAQARLAAGAE